MDPLAMITLDTWVTSDQHWGHKNIRRYQDRPMEHEDLMLKRWHALVGPTDVVLHLGDLVVFPHADQRAGWGDRISRLPGIKYLILGNHDRYSKPWYEAAGFRVLGRGNRPYFWSHPETEQVVAFSHEPVEDCGGWEINVHGHIHSNVHHPEATRLHARRNVSVEVIDYGLVRLRDLFG